MAELLTLRSRAAQVLVAGSLAYTAVLVFLTHYPKPQELLGEDLPPDKMLHFLAYGVLGFLVTAAVVARGRWSWRTAAITGTALAAFAALDELTQPWFGRNAEPLDWVWDLIGILAGIAAVAAVRWLLRSQLGRALQPALPVESQ
jgi:VanZ family protein